MPPDSCDVEEWLLIVEGQLQGQWMLHCWPARRWSWGQEDYPQQNVVAEVVVFDRDWVLSDMVVGHEMFDMEVLETWRMDGNEQTRSKTNV